jgi:hypothetical protein
MSVTPNRERLRALYDAAIQELSQLRPNTNLTSGFYATMGNSVFEAGYTALSYYCAGTCRVPYVAAPAGSGKTSFSYALLLAVTRYADSNPSAPYGCVFVVDQIKKADEVYKELATLLPGKVAIWTKEHDPKCKKREKVLEPAAQFTQDQLRHHPIIVVTHQFYNGKGGNKAHLIVRDGDFGNNRALTVVDEKPEEVTQFEIIASEAETISEVLKARRPEIKEPLDALRRVILSYTFEPASNQIFRPANDLRHYREAETLKWFTTSAAATVVKTNADIPGIERLFGIARAITSGRVFATAIGKVVRYIGWQSKLMVRPGMLLLDATADIDGISEICLWREPVSVPQARYDNLEIVHVPQHTKRRLSEYLKTAPNQRAYVKRMVETIRQHMAPGERGLVVCKKALFDAQRVPNWTDGDPRFETPDLYTKHYGWEIDGRMVCATHWGTGIGTNDWKDADVVFLLDEFYIPRRTAIATVQGLRQHRADEGDLASMTTVNSKAKGVDAIAEGHRLRHTKQLALRGRGRCYDEQGLCGKQRLVVSSELKSFMSNVGKLFPGANIRTASDYTEDGTWAHKVLELLCKPTLSKQITTKQIGRDLGKPWRELSSNLLKDETFMQAVDGLGWRYVKGAGRGGSKFERMPSALSQAA